MRDIIIPFSVQILDEREIHLFCPKNWMKEKSIFSVQKLDEREIHLFCPKIG
jgi:hypothetical protein